MLIVEKEATDKGSVATDPLQDSPTRKSFELGAWQIGVNRYLSSLPADVKQAFKAPANADDCLQLLYAARSRNRKFDKIITILQPLVEPLKRFESSVDVLVQTYSSIASPIWGPLKILVTAASNRLNTLHSIVILLERLVEPLKRFQNYELMFHSDGALRQTIGNLYCDLIEFCTRLVAHQGKSPLRKTFASFDKDVAEISGNIAFHWAEVDIAANAAHMVEAKAARVKEDSQRACEFQRDINRWLAPSTPEDDFQRLISQCADGSCKWITKTSEMMHFQERTTSTSLRLCSWPGGGKSVATSSLVRHFQSQAEQIVLYFFCRSTDAEKSFTTSIARTLVWQLLQAEPELYGILAPIYNRSGRQIADSEVLVFEIFDIVMKNTKNQVIYIILDALDECNDASTLINLLTATQKSSSAKIKLLVTSRDDPDLVEQLSFCTSRILLQENKAPLESYISTQVQHLKLPLTETERDVIRTAIVAGSNGLWLFGKLILDELKKASSITEIYGQLQTVPDGLAQLYNTVLQNREKQFSKNQIKIASQIYLWLRLTDYIPADLWKSRSVGGLDDEVINIILQYLTKTDAEIFKPIELILRLCSPLVTTRLLHEDHLILYIDGKPIHCTAFVAEFFHQTADQYLNWCSEAPPGATPLAMRPRRLAELHRGACAAWYFGESEHFQRALYHLQERPRSGVEDCWLEMACGLWQALTLYQLRRNLTPDELDEAQDLCNSIIIFLTTDRCLAFVEASIILHYAGEFSLLAKNVQSQIGSSMLTTISSRSKLPFIESLIQCCDLFKADLLYSITRFSASGTASAIEDIEALQPEGFDKRPRARKIFALARKYRYLALASHAVSINGFLLGGKT